VLSGRPTLRTPSGERRLRSWDTAVFLRGEAGAHEIRNDGDGPARVLMVSSASDPEVTVYPDDGEVAVFADWSRREREAVVFTAPFAGRRAEDVGDARRVVNLADAEPGDELLHGAFRHFDRWIAEELGAELLGCSLYDVPPGARNWPYHFHVGNEEWLLVVAGRPTLRTPGGERQLEPASLAAFADGEAGAHDIANRTAENVRVAIFSTLNRGHVVYPDAGKVGAGGRYFRVGDAVDYWDGE
jgi:uncharacterized cupin superfamily protein